MEIIENEITIWKYYISEEMINVNIENCGKWMYFFKENQLEEISLLCREAIQNEILTHVKHTASDFKDEIGVACFYINGFDTEQHKMVLKYFMQKNMIPRNKNGKYRNIAFKFDIETRNGIYGKDFKAKLNLSDLVNVETGEFIN